jgi:hypothetical protein
VNNAFFEDEPVTIFAAGTTLFKEPEAAEPRAYIADLSIDEHLPREFTRPENFKRAGDWLITGLGDGVYNGASDRILFPTVYCYRHGVEVLLKELIRSALRYEVHRGNPDPQGHSLLWKKRGQADHLGSLGQSRPAFVGINRCLDEGTYEAG